MSCLLVQLGRHKVEGSIENYCFGVPTGSSTIYIYIYFIIITLSLISRFHQTPHFSNVLMRKSLLTAKTKDTPTIGYQSIKSPNWFGISHSYSLSSTTQFKFQVEVYGIKYNGVPLQGWLHVVISVSNKDAAPQRFVINARGYTGSGYSGNNPGWVSGIGEFSPRFPACDDIKDDSSEQSNSNQFMPCGGIPPFEPTVSKQYRVETNEEKETLLQGVNSLFTYTLYNKSVVCLFRLDMAL